MAAEVAFEEGLTQRRVSGETIRATLVRLLGVRWMRAKRCITSSDPLYERRRGRLMEIPASDPEWATAFEDECWWSRVALPTLSSWAQEGKPLRLIQKSVAKDDREPKAISCYGLYVPELDGETWLWFVDGRPVSHITTRFLEWSCQKLQALGKKVLLLIWDNASWHVSKEVRRWLGSCLLALCLYSYHLDSSGEGEVGSTVECRERLENYLREDQVSFEEQHHPSARSGNIFGNG
jgi:hypothetical protein